MLLEPVKHCQFKWAFEAISYYVKYIRIWDIQIQSKYSFSSAIPVYKKLLDK
jgi:hypothetical protein